MAELFVQLLQALCVPCQQKYCLINSVFLSVQLCMTKMEMCLYVEHVCRKLRDYTMKDAMQRTYEIGTAVQNTSRAEAILQGPQTFG